MEDELGEIEQLKARADELARQHEEKDVDKMPIVRGPYEPTEGKVARHNLTHTNFKPWCPPCIKCLAG